MSTYNEWCGVVPLKLGTPKEAVLGAICGAIGAEYQELYFPIGEVLELSDDKQDIAAVDFGLIPPEGAHDVSIEAAMLALAPFVDTSDDGFVEVEMVSGMNWNDAFMYRFVHGTLEISGARLRSEGNWTSVEARPQQFQVQRVHTDG